MKKKTSGKRILILTVTYLLLGCGMVLCLLPLFWQIRSSLMNNMEIFVFPPKLLPEVFLWENYTEALSSFDFLLYFRNTMTILIPAFLGTVLTSTLTAYAFARLRFPGRNIWFALAIGSMMLPGVVTMIPTYVLWSKLSLVNTFVPLILPAWFGGGAFNIFLLRQFFRSIPMSIDEAARIDGAGHLRILFQLLVPALRPALITISLFTFMNIWNDYFSPLIYLNDEIKFTLALGLVQFQGAYASQWSYLMAASTVMILPMLVLFFIGQKYFIEGITFTGVKG